jgi:pyrroline-5-carboxylate reductase
MNSIVFIGGGRITGALLAGLRLAKYNAPIIVHDRNPQKLGELRRKYGVRVEKNLHQAVAQARLLIIAVRPASVADLLREFGPPDRSLPAVSLAAGIPFSKLRAGLGSPVKWARAMPSPVCRTGHGFTGLAFDRNFPVAARREVSHLFSSVGSIVEIPESRFDAFTVTYSCSQGYHALAALSAAAQKLGLDRKTALQVAAHALADGIVAWREGRVPLDELLHEATTPGGIAAATMDAMDRAGYSAVIEKGVVAGLKRARKNAQNF